MTKEEAREAAYAKAFDAGCKITTGNYFGSNTDEKTRAMFGTVWDAAIDYAAANQWTYLPELPIEFLLDRFLVTLANGKVFEATYNGNLFFPSVIGYFTSANPVIAWRPLPAPAKIRDEKTSCTT